MARDLPVIFLIGATGLVGEAVLARENEPLHYLARREAATGARHHAIIAPSDAWASEIAALKPDILISALGTTMRQAGSEAAFYAVDHDVQIAAAQAAKLAGARHFIGVSAIGASATSRNFYLRTKGEVEQAVIAMGFDRTDILRPGLLTGDRKGEPRFAEGFGNRIAPLMDALLIGGLKKYRSVSDGQMADAIGVLAKQVGAGVFVHQSDGIHALAD